jgi:ATP-dependent DNA helicase PIF1
VFCGDFYQLGPVQPDKETKFLFEDQVWGQTIDASVYLTEVYRQTESDFVSMLHRIRVGDVDNDMIKKISATSAHALHNKLGIKPTTLFCMNKDVDAINKASLDRLKTAAKVELPHYDYFENDAYKKLYEKSFTLPKDLELKVGAQVMLLININTEDGLVNGSRGVVVGMFDQLADEDKGLVDENGKMFDRPPYDGIKVLFLDGKTRIIKAHKQAFKDGDDGSSDMPDRAYRIQYPLKLAYALTIHKSQGLSIDYLEVDLRGSFCPGQAYVALSRATSFKNLRVKNFSARAVITSGVVKKFYGNISLGEKRERTTGELERMFDKVAKRIVSQ